MNSSIAEEIQAILFDLDGTLLDINLDVFIPQYLKTLSAKVAHLIRPSKFISKLMIASQAIDKNDGSKTNDALFAEIFFPSIGFPREEMEPYFDKYYSVDFPNLRQYAQEKPDAREVMEYIFSKGYDVVIATTPLLPETAITQRLEWAGVGDFSYKLITTLDNSNYNKSDLRYYHQILEKIGHPAEACLMVGDEDKDMAASRLGMKTFLINSPQTNLDPTTPKPNYQGTLKDLIPIL